VAFAPEFVSRPAEGRRFGHRRRVRLSDAGPDALLRLDGVARYLQDVATDDWADSGLDPDETWVVRRTTVRLSAGRWPGLGEEVTLVTWCGGMGPAWAERRTDLEVSGSIAVETVALWVPLDASGRPKRLGPPFHDVYGEAAGGRRVPGRLESPPPLPEAPGRPWWVRRTDVDVVGHVNNAAVWAAVSEVAGGDVTEVTVSHHNPIDANDAVRLVEPDAHDEASWWMWLAVGDDVRVSARLHRAR
jgi:acyl-ACP thioesterase